MAQPRSLEALMDAYVPATLTNGHELIRALPPARKTSCYGLTADGTRHVFPTVQALLRWSTRTADVQALCLDNCVWRSYASFRRNLNQGMSVDMAFEAAVLHNWEAPLTVARRRSAEHRAA